MFADSEPAVSAIFGAGVGPAWLQRLLHKYKLKYAAIRDRGERVIIDGVCNSACTLVLGIVPLNRICVTPRASLGFHTAYFDRSYTFGIKLTSYWDTADMLAYYPEKVKKWLDRRGGLTPDIKTMKSGPELWAIIHPCPKERARRTAKVTQDAR